MAKTIHIVTDDCYPSPGGMQASVLRVARILAKLPETTCEIIILGSTTDIASEPPDIKVYSLARKMYGAASPLLLGTGLMPSSYRKREELSRLSFLILRNHVQERLDERPTNTHLILSFYLTDVGFVSQQVASSVGVSHITSIRGSDYSRGFFCPDTIAAVEYVLRRVDHIVTTNEQQRSSIERFFDIREKVSVIYNSQNGVLPSWKPHQRNYVKLFSDSGYAHKKGTHILMSAFDTLRAEGTPVRLKIVGRTKESEKPFWDKYRGNLSHLYPGEVEFLGPISLDKICLNLLEADVFCSGTLGEGCSQARTRALLTGMPIVTTICGEVADLFDQSRYYASPCGDIEGFTASLRLACADVLSGERSADQKDISWLRELFSERRESRLWADVIRSIDEKESIG